MNVAKLLLLMTVASFAIIGCDTNDGGAENLGEAIDETGDKIGDAATDAGNAIEDACEDVKEGVDADDTDC
jgi:predicted small secreted protein